MTPLYINNTYYSIKNTIVMMIMMMIIVIMIIIVIIQMYVISYHAKSKNWLPRNVCFRFLACVMHSSLLGEQSVP